MEELKDEIIRLALFYADVILGIEKAYASMVAGVTENPQAQDLMEEVNKNYEKLCDENLKELAKRAEAIAAKYTIDSEDDLK